MHTHVPTYSYSRLQDLVLHRQACHVALSHTHTCSSSHSSKAQECASSISHPPRQAGYSSEVGVLNWGEPSCNVPEHLCSWPAA